MKSFYSFLIACLVCAGGLKAREVNSSKPQNNFQLNNPAALIGNGQANATNNLIFVENKGQITDQDYKSRPDIQFKLAAAGGLNVFIGSAAIHYQFSKLDNPQQQDAYDFKQTHLDGKVPDPTIFTMYRMDVELIGADKSAQVITEQKQDYYENYYIPGTGENGAKVLAHKKITYKEVYPHIDWVLYTRGGQLKHEFVVRKGGRVSDIQLKYGGATDLQIREDGSLLARTPQGIITEEAPFTTQADGKAVRSSFRLSGDVLSYETAGYEGELLIDPGLSWATYYGGSGNDYGQSVATDHLGNVYMAGQTLSPSLIASTGAYQTTFGGVSDAFLVKFDAVGVRQWATYYGGANSDNGNAVATDGAGNIYLSGFTASPSGIASPGAYQTIIGGLTDAYLAKFDDMGTRLWATYYGGAGGDGAFSMATDGLGGVYMAGQTTSTSGIASPGAYQTTCGGTAAYTDAFLVKFNGSGVRLWATYYGGAGTEAAYSVATDGMANVYMAGETVGGTGVASSGSHQATYGGGSWDAFLVKFNASGARQWATYYGGSGDEVAYSVATDGTGNVYMTGFTSSASAIASSAAFQSTYGGGNDAFLVKFDNLGTRQWATYYGGSSSDVGYSVATDTIGNVYMTGSTYSASGIATPGAFQIVYAKGTDAFWSKFDGTGMREYATYFGDTSNDVANSITTDGLNNVYIAGTTNSMANVATPGAYQTYLAGSNDGFLAAFYNVDTITGMPVLCLGATTTLSDADAGGSWSCSNTAITTVGVGSGVVSGISTGTAIITYKLLGSWMLTTVTVTTLPSAGTVTGASSVCVGDTIILSDTAAGGVWSSGSAKTTTIGAGKVKGAIIGIDTIIYTVTNVCGSATASKTVAVIHCKTAMTERINGSDISIYPNPANNVLTITSPIKVSAVITGIDGKRWLDQAIGATEINISSLANGLYFIALYDEYGERIKVEKLIKE